MGKLVEKLQQIGQSSGSGIGFFGRSRTPTQATRPASIFVVLGTGDTAAAAAAVKNGADAVIVTGWKPNADLSRVKSALEGSSVVWGVEVAGDFQPADGALKSVQEAGAAFAVVAPNAPVSLLLEEHEKFDLAVMVDPPTDDLGLVLLRAENLLPVQVALLRTRFTNADIAKLTVADFARLRLLFEGLRFPTLVSLKEAPEAANVKALVRMGADGLVLPGEGLAADQIGAQVKALREELEKTPERPDEGSSVAIGGLMEASGTSLQQPSRREPEPEPEHE